MSSLTVSEVAAAAPALELQEKPTAVRLENISVQYRVPHERISSFKEYAIRFLQRRVSYHEFNALEDVNLEVREGECLGIIGRNGAGKSTLLKVVSRVMKPTRGRVWVRGRVAPLLELAAGFHGELTGRENVFLNGTLLGYTRAEMASRFESIVEFAELQEFIDAPLRTYSSGMAARLGFAVATSAQPDVLILDEVLSVGDEQFQEKCKARMDQFRAAGTTILFVAHSTRLIREMCDRAAWLDHGQVRAQGAVDEVIASYQNSA